MFRFLIALAGFGVLLSPSQMDATQARPEVPSLSFPLDCKLHESCFIQNYVDLDQSLGAKDYRCGQTTYDGHKGTDFRLISVQDVIKGVPVLAATRGIVKAARDGVKDRLYYKDSQPEYDLGKECGNGVVIDHGQGWVTQYCHMRRGSVSVRRGQTVKRREQLGFVGYSGKAQFAHLHLSVRHKGRVVDPFTGHVPTRICGLAVTNGLWEGEAARAMAYRPGEVIELGFSIGPVNTRVLEEGKISQVTPSIDSPALVFFARFINLLQGDRLHLELRGPAGLLAKSTTLPIERHKAQYVAFVGQKLKTHHWPSGRYIGDVKLMRAGNVMLEREASLVLHSKPRRLD